MLNINLEGKKLPHNGPLQINPTDIADPLITFQGQPDKYYALSLSPKESFNNFNVLIVNIPGDKNIDAGNAIVPFRPPNPQNKNMTYLFKLYQQNGYINDPNIHNFIGSVIQMYEVIVDPNLQYRDRNINPVLSEFNINRDISNLELNNSGARKSIKDTKISIPPLPSYSSYSSDNNNNNKVTSPKSSNKKDWFKPDTTLNQQEQKYCRCVLKVAAKQPGQCNIEKAWFEQRQGQECYNPYAVCAKTVGTTSRECGDNYNFAKIPEQYLQAYVSLNNIPTNGQTRQYLLDGIYQWKKLKYAN